MNHSKSGLFLMELLINLLLFCVLCSCSLTFFIKSQRLTKDSKTLQHAVSLSTSIASLYENSDLSLTYLCNIYKEAEVIEDGCYIYFDENYLPCPKEVAVYIIETKMPEDTTENAQITFYEMNGERIYSIQVRQYSPRTLGEAKEVLFYE